LGAGKAKECEGTRARKIKLGGRRSLDKEKIIPEGEGRSGGET